MKVSIITSHESFGAKKVRITTRKGNTIDLIENSPGELTLTNVNGNPINVEMIDPTSIRIR